LYFFVLDLSEYLVFFLEEKAAGYHTTLHGREHVPYLSEIVGFYLALLFIFQKSAFNNH
jgi:hypothetical protein